MTDIQFVRVDDGSVNTRILMNGIMADFRRVEVASVKTTTRFSSPEAKRLFVRYFNTLQLNDHFVSVIASTQINFVDIERAERKLDEKMELVTAELNKSIDESEALFKSHGITNLATHDTVPMEITVGIISSTGRSFLDLLDKFDQLMPLIQTLQVNKVISKTEAKAWRIGIKRSIRELVRCARYLALEMKRRMYAFKARETEQERQKTGAARSASKSNSNTSNQDTGKLAIAEKDPLEQPGTELNPST